MQRRYRELAGRLEAGLALGLLALPTASVWFFGGVAAEVQSVMAIALSIMLLLYLAFQARRQIPTSFEACPRLVWMLLLGLLLGMLQLVPLPSGAVRWVASGATSWRADQVPQKENGASIPSDVGTSVFPFPQTRSLYPPLTRKCLAQLVIAVAACVFAMQVMRSDRALWLLRCLVGLGVALAVFGIVQKLQWDGRIYWTFPIGEGRPFGPFVNRNNAGGFLNLCLAGCVGMLVRRFANQAESNGEGDFGPRGLGRLSAWDIAAWVAFIVVMAGAVSTVSRSSILAVGIAGLATMIGLRLFAGWKTGAATVALAILSVGLVYWVGVEQEIEQRWESTVSEDAIEKSGRLWTWSETLQALPEFLVLGSGLETYKYVGLPYHGVRLNPLHHHYAENAFVQTLVELGLVGLLLLLLAVASVVVASLRLLRSDRSLDLAIGATGLFGIVGQVVAGFFDFGSYIPANMVLMSIMFGTVVIRGWNLRIVDDRSSRAGRTGMAIPVMITFPLVVASLFAGIELWRLAEADRFAEPASVSAVVDSRSVATIDQRIEVLNRVVSSRWDDAAIHAALSELWLARFRVGLFEQLGTERPWADKDELWQQTTVENLQASSFFGMEVSERFTRIAEPTDVFQRMAESDGALKRATRHAMLSIRACPWMAASQLQYARMLWLVDDANVDANVPLEMAERFAGGQPSFWYECGVLRALGGDREGAQGAWQRMSAISPQRGARIRPWLEGLPVAEQMAFLVPRGDVMLAWSQASADETTSAQFARRGLEVMPQGDLSAIELATRAYLQSRLGQSEAAIRDWQTALSGQQVYAWQMALVAELEKIGKLKEAWELIGQMNPKLKWQAKQVDAARKRVREALSGQE